MAARTRVALQTGGRLSGIAQQIAARRPGTRRRRRRRRSAEVDPAWPAGRAGSPEAPAVVVQPPGQVLRLGSEARTGELRPPPCGSPRWLRRLAIRARQAPRAPWNDAETALSPAGAGRRREQARRPWRSPAHVNLVVPQSGSPARPPARAAGRPAAAQLRQRLVPVALLGQRFAALQGDLRCDRSDPGQVARAALRPVVRPLLRTVALGRRPPAVAALGGSAWSSGPRSAQARPAGGPGTRARIARGIAAQRRPGRVTHARQSGNGPAPGRRCRPWPSSAGGSRPRPPAAMAAASRGSRWESRGHRPPDGRRARAPRSKACAAAR